MCNHCMLNLNFLCQQRWRDNNWWSHHQPSSNHEHQPMIWRILLHHITCISLPLGVSWACQQRLSDWVLGSMNQSDTRNHKKKYEEHNNANSPGHVDGEHVRPIKLVLMRRTLQTLSVICFFWEGECETIHVVSEDLSYSAAYVNPIAVR